MTFVLNRNWGGFTLPQGYVDAYGLEDVYDYDEATIRTDARLIEWMRKFPLGDGYACGDLGLVEIPDNCTDYEINENDGAEFIIYVINGKIHHA